MAVPPPNAASARALRERKAQLDRLLSDELPRNRREIQEAKEFGDLSENFEYESARNKERQLLARLETLQREIREAAEFDFSLAEAGEEAAPGTRRSRAPRRGGMRRPAAARRVAKAGSSAVSLFL